MASPDYYNDSFEVDAAGEEQIELPLGIKLDLDNDDELLLQEELNQLDQNTDYQDDYDENNYILPGISNYNNNEEINEDLDRMPRRRNKKKTKGPINQNYNNNESEEIQRLHSIIKNQTVKIRSLTNDKKGLEKVTRYQSRQLMEYDKIKKNSEGNIMTCLLYTSPSPRDRTRSRMPSSA